MGGRRDRRPVAAAVGPLLPDAEGRRGPDCPPRSGASTASRVRFELHDGLEVICRGHLEVYAPRGRYQLIIEEIEPRGIGALELALRQLRERLAREGLFDAARKRPLPRFPRRIAVVTSPTGAAMRDFLEVLRRRWRGVDVLVVPSRVQGEGAAEEIAAAIALVNRLDRRPSTAWSSPAAAAAWRTSGHSTRRWWSGRSVPRGSPSSPGVGHEIDVTLSDLAADVRALTPSEAAARVVPAAEEIDRQLQQFGERLTGAVRWRLVAARRRWETLAGHRAFARPLAWVHDLARRVDELESRLLRSVRQCLRHARQAADALAGRLDSLSPLAVLGRGYSLTQRVRDGRIVRDAGELTIGEAIRTRFAEGQAISRVEGIEGTPQP